MARCVIFCNFYHIIYKSCANDLENLDQGQKSLHVIGHSCYYSFFQNMEIINSELYTLQSRPDKMQGSFCACVQPMRGNFTMQRHLSLAWSIRKMIPEDVTYFNSLIGKTWLNSLENIMQGQKSLHVTHPLILVTFCTKYGKNPFRTAGAKEHTQVITDGQMAWHTDWQTGCIDYTQLTLMQGRIRKNIW